METQTPKDATPEPQTGGRPETRGEYLVGLGFNPSNNLDVDLVKQKAADLIDTIDGLQKESATTRQADEIGRCISLAITHVETAAMFAVKAATKKP